jgi:hypothetical protein
MTVSVTNTLTNGQANDADEVMENFDDLTSYINSNVVLKDGSVAFTGLVSGPNLTPTTDNHLARKKYVDDNVGMVSALYSPGTHTATNTSYQTVGTIQTISNPNKAVNVWALFTGNGLAAAFCTRIQTRLGISFDGGSNYTTWQQWGTNANADYIPISVQGFKTGTPTGDIKIRVEFQSVTTTGSVIGEGALVHQMFKSVSV